MLLEEEMTEREMIVPERGIMTATHQEGTLTAIAIIAGEAAVTVVVAAAVGARTTFETVKEREIEIGTEIAAEASHSAEHSLQAGAEV